MYGQLLFYWTYRVRLLQVFRSMNDNLTLQKISLTSFTNALFYCLIHKSLLITYFLSLAFTYCLLFFPLPFICFMREYQNLATSQFKLSYLFLLVPIYSTYFVMQVQNSIEGNPRFGRHKPLHKE